MPREYEETARDAAEAVARRSYGKLVALLAARTRDVAGAEDALSDAFAAALVEWPAGGVPDNPEAWLMTVARRKQIDALRRRRSRTDAADHLRLMADEIEAAAASETKMPDERLALMFACAHPAIDPGIRAPLILQTILGFDAAAIGSAFLVSPATMAQRLVRAKSKIRHAGIPFQVPERVELGARLDAVLEAIYAAFSEGWSDPAGTEVRRRNLAEEGIWLGRLVASLLPDEPEALGLLSLMLYAQARRDARRDAQGEYVPLADQDPAVGRAADRRGRRPALARQCHARDRPLPARSGGAVGSCRSPTHRPRRLGGDRAHLRRPPGDDRLARGGDQSGHRGGRDARPRRRPRGARRALGRPATHQLSALLGGARRAAGADGRRRSGRCSLRAGDRPGGRSRRPPLPAAPPRGAARTTLGPNRLSVKRT